MHQPPSHSRHRSLRPAIISFLLAVMLLGSLHDWRTPELHGASEPTPLAYLPLIARPGATTTTIPVPTRTLVFPTSTPTETPTNTATPTETPTQTCSGVYPIAIGAVLLNQSGFVPPTDPAEQPYYGIYNDATYTNKTQRRVYRAINDLTGYIILNWTGDPSGGTATSFAAAITGTGTLAQGFNEVVPWPDPSTIAPTGYPLYPHQLTEGDWITGSTGNTASSDISAALNYHIDHKTVMSLPIIDRYVGNGQNVAVHFVRMGQFLLRGFSITTSPYYLDLVYLGPTDVPQCP